MIRSLWRRSSITNTTSKSVVLVDCIQPQELILVLVHRKVTNIFLLLSHNPDDLFGKAHVGSPSHVLDILQEILHPGQVDGAFANIRANKHANHAPIGRNNKRSRISRPREIWAWFVLAQRRHRVICYATLIGHVCDQVAIHVAFPNNLDLHEGTGFRRSTTDFSASIMNLCFGLGQRIQNVGEGG